MVTGRLHNGGTEIPRSDGGMKGVYFHRSLRHKNIDYGRGRFFVTIQVAHNKPLLGAIVGERCVLNELGKGIEETLVRLPSKYPELKLGEFVIMPNHVHTIFIIQRLTKKKKKE